jgi:hypothetical protein
LRVFSENNFKITIMSTSIKAPRSFKTGLKANHTIKFK